MCQATVFLKDDQVAEDVISLEPVDGGVELRTFFTDPIVVPGKVVKIDFLKHQVLLEPLEEREDG